MIKRRENKAYIVLEIRDIVNGKPKNIKTISLELATYAKIQGFIEEVTAPIITGTNKTTFHMFTRHNGKKLKECGTLTFTIPCLHYMSAYETINRQLDNTLNHEN